MLHTRITMKTSPSLVAATVLMVIVGLVEAQVGRTMIGWSTAFDNCQGVDTHWPSSSFLSANWGCTDRGLGYGSGGKVCAGSWEPTVYRADAYTLVEVNYNRDGTALCDYPADVVHDSVTAHHYLAWKIGAGCSHSCSSHTYSGTVARGCGDFMVSKYNDADSSKVWVQRLGGSNEEQIRRLLSLPDGNLVIGGDTLSSTMASPWNAGTGTNPNGNGVARDIYVGKFGTGATSFTSPIWQFAIRGSGNDALQELKADSEGNVIVSFYSETSLFGFTHAGGKDGYHAIYDSATGSFIAAMHLGTAYDEIGISSCGGDPADVQKKVFTLTITKGWLGDNPNTKLTNEDYDHVFCGHYRNGGTLAKLWCKQYLTTSKEDSGAIAYNKARRQLVYVVQVGGDWDGPNTGIYASGLSDIAIGALNIDTGERLWNDQIGTTTDDYPAPRTSVDPTGAYISASFMTKGLMGSITPDVDNRYGAGRANVVTTAGNYNQYAFLYPYCDPGKAVSRLDLKTCTECVPGTATIRQNSCDNCPAGSYSSTTGAHSCTLCQPGFIQPTIAQMGCEACPPGTFFPALGGTNCFSCPAGTYSTGEAGSCSQCSEGTYQDELGQSSCKQCPGGRTSDSGSTDLSYCKCPKGTFGPSANTTTADCTPCPSNAVCDYDVLYPTAISGYWLTTDEPSTVVMCVPSEACPGGQGQCNHGYAGYGCSQCTGDDTFRLSSGQCLDCSAQDISSRILPLFTLLGIVFAILAIPILLLADIIIGIVNKKPPSSWFLFSHHLLLLIDTIQMASFAVTTQLRLEQPMEFLSTFGTLTFGYWDSLQVTCLLGMEYQNEAIWSTLHFLAGVVLIGGILVVICGIFTLSNAIGHNRIGVLRALMDMTLRSVFLFFTVTYFIFAQRGFSTYYCAEVTGGMFRQVQDPASRCFYDSDAWLLLLPWGHICLIVAVVYPIVMTLVVVLPVKVKSMAWAKESLSFIWTPYEARFFYWPIIKIVYKFLLAFSYMLTMVLGDVAQTLWVVVVCTTMIMVHIRVMPLEDEKDDQLEFIMLFSVMLSSNMSFMGKGTIVSTSFLTLILVSLYVFTFFRFVLSIWRHIRVKTQKKEFENLSTFEADDEKQKDALKLGSDVGTYAKPPPDNPRKEPDPFGMLTDFAAEENEFDSSRTGTAAKRKSAAEMREVPRNSAVRRVPPSARDDKNKSTPAGGKSGAETQETKQGVATGQGQGKLPSGKKGEDSGGRKKRAGQPGSDDRKERAKKPVPADKVTEGSSNKKSDDAGDVPRGLAGLMA